MKRERFSNLALALAFALAIVVAVSACSDSLGPNRGRVRMVLGSDASSFNLGVTAAGVGGDRNDANDGESHDRPSRWFRAANVTLSSVLVRNSDGVLVNLDLDVPVTVDVVQLENGRRIQLPDGVLPVGEYDQVVLVMTAVQGVMLDGTIVTIQPPGGGWTAIIPICTFDVAEGDTDVVGLNLVVRNAFSRGSTSSFHFQPQFRGTADCVD